MLGLTTLFPPRPKPLTMAAEADERHAFEYNELAVKLGTAARATIQAVTIPHILVAEAIHVYDLARVERYMDAKGEWSWFPLRNQNAGIRPLRVTKQPRFKSGDYGDLHPTLYLAPVPFPVLLTVERIVERCGMEPVFFVAALDEHPDPFLAVMSRYDWTRMTYVIERWDAPSFR